MASISYEEELGKQLDIIFGEKLSQTELENSLKEIQIVEPPIAKQFWKSKEANPGIYIVLSGKVRLQDKADNLIMSLSKGASFGEMTLFPEEDFQPYSARASTNLKLCYLRQETLQILIDKYPTIRDRLQKCAELWNLLLLCRQNSQKQDFAAEKMAQVLSLFERHHFEALSKINLPTDIKLCLLSRGEIQHNNGHYLTPSIIYTDLEPSRWQATQPTTIYILKDAKWPTALSIWPQLTELLVSNSSTHSESTLQNGSRAAEIAQDQKVIPFPHVEPGSLSKQAKQKVREPYFPSPKVSIGQFWGHLTHRYPFFAQQSTSDCGVACVVMVGRYWGKNFSVNRLRDLANVSRSGTSLRSLTAAAESIGFATRPVKASLDRLAQQPLPAIAHWEGKHYVVVYKITPKRVIVGDPAVSQRSLTKAEFKAGWTGYALLLEPTNLLKDTEDDETSLWRFAELIKPHTWILLEVFVASVLIQVFGLVTPLLTQLLLDRVIVQGSALSLTAVGLGLLIFGLFRIAMTGLRQYLLDHTANRVVTALMVGFMKHTFRLPIAFFESRYVGDIVSRFQENEKIQRFVTGEALSICLDMLTVFVYVGLMLWYSWRLTLLCLAIIPPFLLLAFFATPFFLRINREIFNALANENSYLIQSLTGIRSIRSMAIEQTVRWRWEEQLNQFIKKMFSGQIISNQVQVFSLTIQSLVTTGLLWYGAWLVIQNQLTVGQLIAFNMLLAYIIQPFQRLSVLWNQLQEITVSAERINDVLEAEPEEDLLSSPRQSLSQLRGHIYFDHVTFRYHPDSEVNVLENLSFEIQPEQTVAVVGRSGSGKTTLSKLILGLYPPSKGKVLIDGQDITHIALHSLRQQIGIVDQDTFLFGDTIRENISIAHPEASLEEIITAARLAGADEFIKQLPLGYETQIGEGGGMLSGGQRQRIAIARALLGNPRFLIFDEATSHLDAESEKIIQNNLKQILKGRTSIIIAHRLSTVRNADLILVLDRGVLIESGSHNELIARKGHYYYLNQQQLTQMA